MQGCPEGILIRITFRITGNVPKVQETGGHLELVVVDVVDRCLLDGSGAQLGNGVVHRGCAFPMESGACGFHLGSIRARGRTTVVRRMMSLGHGWR